MNNRQYLAHVVRVKGIGMHGFFPGKHLVHIALNSIDFTVVYDKVVRMRSFPARVGVGGETGMHHGNGGSIGLIL